jgi:mono/diheme cytochrome c family protein
MRLLILVLMASSYIPTGAAQTANGNLENGKRLFRRDGCWQCHGYAGQGGRAGARIAATVLSAPALIRYVRRPTGEMPAYSEKVVSDQELTDVWAYLKSMTPPKPAKDIPLLRDIKER